MASLGEIVLPGDKRFGHMYGMDGHFAQQALSYASRLVAAKQDAPPSVIIFGGAAGLEAIEFAKRGCRVTVIDLGNFQTEIDAHNASLAVSHPHLAPNPISFISADARTLDPARFAEKFDMAWSRNLAHFFEPHDNVAFFSVVNNCVKKNGRAFITFVGKSLEDLAEPFADLENRFVVPKVSTYINVPLIQYNSREAALMFMASGLDIQHLESPGSMVVAIDAMVLTGGAPNPVSVAAINNYVSKRPVGDASPQTPQSRPDIAG